MSSECDDCSCYSHDNFLQALHVMNQHITDEQRKAFNEYHRILWNLADQIKDRMHSPSLTYNDGVLGEKLKNIICNLPWLEK